MYIHNFEELACSFGNQPKSVAVLYPTRRASSTTPLQKASNLTVYFNM